MPAVGNSAEQSFALNLLTIRNQMQIEAVKDLDADFFEMASRKPRRQPWLSAAIVQAVKPGKKILSP